jgi:hypothetical protein
VKEEDVVYFIAEEQSKGGATVILDSCGNWGELHLGGFMASGTRYVQERRITHIVNAAAGLESFFVGWAKGLTTLEGAGMLHSVVAFLL